MVAYCFCSGFPELLSLKFSNRLGAVSYTHLVLPSEWENMPCVIIEAMSSGLPVVSTNVGGIPEIINDEVGVLVPPKNSVRLVKALDSILNNLPSFSRERIVELARERYSYEAVGEVLNNLYRSCLLYTSLSPSATANPFPGS